MHLSPMHQLDWWSSSMCENWLLVQAKVIRLVCEILHGNGRKVWGITVILWVVDGG